MKQISANLSLIPNTLGQATNPREVVYNKNIIQLNDEFPLFEFKQVYFDQNGKRKTRITSTSFLEKGEYRLCILPGADIITPSYDANADLQYQLDNLGLLKKTHSRTKLVFITQDNADDQYDWIMNAVHNTPWYKQNPERFKRLNLLTDLGIFAIPDPNCHLLNALGLVKSAENNEGIITKRAQIELENGIAKRIFCEHDSAECAQNLEASQKSDLESIEEHSAPAMEGIRTIPGTFSLIPTTLADALDLDRRVIHNRSVIESGMRLFDLNFKRFYFDRLGYKSIRNYSTKFLDKGKHCIITLPGAQITPDNLAADPHLQDFIDNLPTLTNKFDSLVIIAKATAQNLQKQIINAIRNAPWYNKDLHNFPDIVQRLRIVAVPDENAALINALGMAADGKYGITSKRSLIIAVDGVVRAVHYQNDPLITDRVQAQDANRIFSSLKLSAKGPAILHGTRPKEKLVIVGGGMVGAMQALLAYLAAKKTGERIRVTVYDKNINIQQTTAANIAPSLTLDEILSVIPFGPALIKALGVSFEDLSGISIDDVINNSPAALKFKEQVLLDCKDEETYRARTNALLQLGKLSMDLWKEIYDTADADLKRIFDESNFHPSFEPEDNENGALNGYRIDLIYDTPNARDKAESMRADYVGVGYKKCRILTPDEAETLDPSQREFCARYSEISEGVRVWKNNAVALYRPGGCLNVQKFLPDLYEYLKKVMGKYTNEHGEEKDCFRLKLRRNVDGVIYGTGLAAEEDDSDLIKGLSFSTTNASPSYTKSNDKYDQTNYFFASGENVGLLTKLGFTEPPFAAFGGASLKIKVKLSAELQKKYNNFSHWKEVHKPGIVLAWQAHCENGEFVVSVAGTKAFHGDQCPKKDDKFAIHRNLLQLNMINDVFPDVISEIFGRDRSNDILIEEDLKYLQNQLIAHCWVGRRSVYYDGVPSFGPLTRKEDGVKIRNAEVANGLGSGGVSFAPITYLAREHFRKKKLFSTQVAEGLEEDILRYADPKRTAPRAGYV